MKISTLLQAKGTSVFTISPDASVAEAVGSLGEHNIGALVVSTDGRVVNGIMSERDVVRAVGRLGSAALAAPVSAIMSVEVRTTSRDDTVESLMMTMTQHRIRHVPVLENGELAGMVSIGDVVKNRMEELERDRNALVDYINAR
ncbi:MAG: CBS domain-containing protein [Actinomycetota bacterium]|jgi:CBS domain-containing protein|nr:CBS domain-containing protein [Actinomycetota bacterium]